MAAASAAPRYLVIPIEDVDWSQAGLQRLPIYRMPGLARQARAAQEDQDSYQIAPQTYSDQAPADR